MKESTLNRFAAERMKPEQLTGEIRRLQHALGLTTSPRERKRFEARLAIFQAELNSRDVVPA